MQNLQERKIYILNLVHKNNPFKKKYNTMNKINNKVLFTLWMQCTRQIYSHCRFKCNKALSTLSAVAVVKSDSSRGEGPVVAFLHAPWVPQSVTEGSQGLLQGVCWVVHDG